MLFETAGRLNQLYELRDILAKAIDDCESMRDLAALSKQFRETTKEIEEIEGASIKDDEIEKILRESDGVPGAVRTDRTKI